MDILVFLGVILLLYLVIALGNIIVAILSFIVISAFICGVLYLLYVIFIAEKDEVKKEGDSFRESDKKNSDDELGSLQEKLVPKEIIRKEANSKQNVSEAGDEGESILTAAFDMHGDFKDCHWWLNKRVKLRIGDSGANEIDLIVVSHNNIYLFESKYWVGTLINNPNKNDKEHPWIRIKHARDRDSNDKIKNNDTDVELIKNLVDDLKEKFNKLKVILDDKKIYIPANKFKTNVIFTHKKFIIDQSVTDRDREYLVTINELDAYLEPDKATVSDAEVLVIALIKHIILNEESMSKVGAIYNNNFDGILTTNISLIHAINSLPSWDYITYYGGRKVKGDVLKILFLFEKQDDLRFLNEQCDLVVDCQRVPEDIKSDWIAGKKQHINIYNNKNDYIGVHDINYLRPMVRFHEVGSPKPIDIFIYEIENIRLRGLYKPSDEKGM